MAKCRECEIEKCEDCGKPILPRFPNMFPVPWKPTSPQYPSVHWNFRNPENKMLCLNLKNDNCDCKTETVISKVNGL